MLQLFFYFTRISENVCSAVASSELLYLKLSSCELHDQGAALTESIRQGRGPKGLCISPGILRADTFPFDFDGFVLFVEALRSSNNLERLDLKYIRERGILQALATALLENRGLTHLPWPSGCSLNDGCRSNILGAFCRHPRYELSTLAALTKN
jgi:hypothetical protein